MRLKDFIWMGGLLAGISFPLLAAEHEWPVYGGNDLHQRHSKLVQINKSNVTGLVEAWEFDTGINDTFQATPVVQDGVMYVSLPFNDVVALDAGNGKQLWRYQHDLDKDYPICCGSANRGVAVANGMVFTGTIDARLIALDAKTGKKRWDHQVIGENTGIREDVSKLDDTELGSVSGTSGAGINMAPMIYQDTVIIGITGVGYGLHLDATDSDSPLGTVVGIAGKFGRRGFMAGYDIHTGEQKWQFDTIKSENWEGNFVTKTADGIELPRDIAKEKAAMKEHADAWRYGGASAWSTPVIDPYTGILHFGTGNPSPQMEGSSRPGDNLYSSSLLALDAKSGDYRWHYQQVPHDSWGYDVASPPVLFDITIKGQPVPAIGQAGKTGWFYVHDRRNGKFLYKSDAFVPQKNMFSLPSAEGTIIYPGVMGGANWSPVSVDARRRLVFIAGIHWPVEYKLHQQAAAEGKEAVRYSSMSPLNTPEKHGLLTAIDLDDGKIVWQVKTENPLIGGVLSTASGLVFTGEGSGELMAFDADSGDKRWSAKTEAGVNAPPISYSIDGKQHIAVAVGGNRLFGFKTGQKIKVWRLP
ncbi:MULTISPECIES: pyrroloquinoline quinone-dependent dehydrogenase [unclassified Methylophaga]|uniref:pyrroloquinoline quinone-dependent dehydrogenase n=1 Tax=unclassified Methylophaga TaxID=2629249 RepID=UPI000C93143B|nr:MULTISPECIES: PQQ-binding-like beta-propeller repeat protein [unclassified Methylophaga]MBN46350.1 pyrrolo-quinoline quinone [Methylophaga sp.]|tara:strand:- start:87157 stop:88908 length:1752 start_codon:yes stop_codon:yes gene_type:complete